MRGVAEIYEKTKCLHGALRFLASGAVSLCNLCVRFTTSFRAYARYVAVCRMVYADVAFDAALCVGIEPCKRLKRVYKQYQCNDQCKLPSPDAATPGRGPAPSDCKSPPRCNMMRNMQRPIRTQEPSDAAPAHHGTCADVAPTGRREDATRGQSTAMTLTTCTCRH